MHVNSSAFINARNHALGYGLRLTPLADAIACSVASRGGSSSAPLSASTPGGGTAGTRGSTGATGAGGGATVAGDSSATGSGLGVLPRDGA